MEILKQIASRLIGIEENDMSKTELDIVKILVKEGYLVKNTGRGNWIDNTYSLVN